MNPVLASKRPYRVFDYTRAVGEVPGLRENQLCWMVSTLTLPQRPVALCGPDKAFAEALCELLNAGESVPAPEALEAVRLSALEEAASRAEEEARGRRVQASDANAHNARRAARDFETMAIQCTHLAADIRALAASVDRSPKGGDAKQGAIGDESAVTAGTAGRRPTSQSTPGEPS